MILPLGAWISGVTADMRFLLILILGGLGIVALSGSPLRAVEQPASPRLESSWRQLREQWDPRPERFINRATALETCPGPYHRSCEEETDSEPRE
jgi:hypothetical protein